MLMMREIDEHFLRSAMINGRWGAMTLNRHEMAKEFCMRFLVHSVFNLWQYLHWVIKSRVSLDSTVNT